MACQSLWLFYKSALARALKVCVPSVDMAAVYGMHHKIQAPLTTRNLNGIHTPYMLAMRARCGYTYGIMMEVLLVNLAWVLLMAVWGVSYFIQARADRAKGGRYIANLEPESKD